MNCGRPATLDDRYCDETCRLTWVVINMSKLSNSQRLILEKLGVGFSMTEEQMDAVLDRLKVVRL